MTDKNKLIEQLREKIRKLEQEKDKILEEKKKLEKEKEHIEKEFEEFKLKHAGTVENLKQALHIKSDVIKSFFIGTYVL